MATSTPPVRSKGPTTPGITSPFEAATAEREPGLLAEFWEFLAHNKKWWLLPIIAILAVLGGLLFLSTTPVAPFIYTLF
jgi:hypothetical protein